MIEIIFTKDGSHTLKNSELNETYHSIHGAVQESMHVFIKHGLDFKMKEGLQEIAILEIGFGTGLNAWLSAKHGNTTSSSISYTSLESFPLDKAIWSKLNYAAETNDKELFTSIHTAEWNKAVSIAHGFTLNKINQTLQTTALPMAHFDIVYFDAFAPEKQPEMWEPSLFKKVLTAMKPGGILVTYCAKGQVKRDLKSVGLVIETLQGPPGKREMIRATKPASESL
jgi:tRNA U34 5-methylaminomethyl-2-thiouridine-forming methyltransferase MnmC